MCLEMAVLKVKQHKKFNTALQQLFYHDTCIQPPPKLELQTKRRLFLLMKKRRVCLHSPGSKMILQESIVRKIYGLFRITNYLVALTLAALEDDSKDRQLPNLVCIIVQR